MIVNCSSVFLSSVFLMHHIIQTTSLLNLRKYAYLDSYALYSYCEGTPGSAITGVLGACDTYNFKVTLPSPRIGSSPSNPSFTSTSLPSTVNPNPYTTSSSDSSETNSCFTGSETVILESRETRPISEVRAGDRVLAADASRRTLFSEVVFVSHGLNADKTVFTHITTAQGRDIKMTHSHILPAGICGSTSPLLDIYASSMTVGDCIMTVSGMEEVPAVEMVQGQGLYTIATKDEYVVANGIIASPFAHNHIVAHLFYIIHRFLYVCVPGLLISPVVRPANEVRLTLSVV
jgi:Hint module